jgi:hypothetical protein
VICPTSYTPHPETLDGSCDEYAFAASRESGGQVVDSGDECAQFVAFGTEEDWGVTLDPRYPAPTWSEECGRASIPGPQNSGVGGDLGRFTTSFRILDSDPYYVATPLFDENCDNVNEWCDVS